MPVSGIVTSESAAGAIPPLAVSLQVAARLLSISPRNLQGLAARGEIPSVPIGTRRLFRVASLDRWLAEQETPRPALPADSPTSLSIDRRAGA